MDQEANIHTKSIIRYLQNVKNIELFAQNGSVTPEGLILYMHSFFAQKDFYDSRILYNFMQKNMEISMKYTYDDWISFAKTSHTLSDGVAFKSTLDLRTSPNGIEFIMLHWLQSSVFMMREISPADISCDDIEGLIFDLSILHIRQKNNPTMMVPMAFLWMRKNKTLEEYLEERKRPIDTKDKKEKRIEEELATQLRLQDQEVKRQVHCSNGIADIVTSNGIYEIKAKLTRKELHHAIAQVLSYRVCINPTATVYVVGCKPKNEEVAVDLARSLGVEVIIWEDSK